MIALSTYIYACISIHLFFCRLSIPAQTQARVSLSLSLYICLSRYPDGCISISTYTGGDAVTRGKKRELSLCCILFFSSSERKKKKKQTKKKRKKDITHARVVYPLKWWHLHR